MFKSGNWKLWEILAFGALVAVGLLVLGRIIASPEGEGDWIAFKEKHHCVSVAEARGSNGSGWYCDDGKVHYRWRQQK